MSNSTSTLVHTHTFQYEVQDSDIPEVPNRVVSFQVDGSEAWPVLLEEFQKYLVAVGYVPPDNSHLDFVPNE